MGAEAEIAVGQGKRGRRDRSNDEAMAELFRDDPSFAVGILQTMLEEDDPDLGAMQMLVRQMTIAFKDGRVVAK